jgi:sodium-dependent dicarboxylate transporter 2/3/5
MTNTGSPKQRIGLWLVPLAALAVLFFADLEPGDPRPTRMAAVAILMAGWWITEAIPIPATALLPVALFPLLGIVPGKTTAAVYFNHIIFLFIGGFLFAIAMERWGLHRRIALRIILMFGTQPRRLLLGFMAATWLLSMWISNTATAMMLAPMAVALLSQLAERYDAEKISRYGVGLLIGIAYAASIGGLATLIGTPPNLSFARILTIVFPDAPDISFARWLLFALPLSVVFLVIAWWMLARMHAPEMEKQAQKESAGKNQFRKAYAELGPIGYEERWVAVLFGLLVLGWTLRTFWVRLLPEPGYVDDGTVAIALALVFFLVASRTPGKGRILRWRDALKIRWGIVLLFGGGFALASGFKESGLSDWLGQALAGIEGVPPLLLILIICASITFLTELTSNTATTEMILPVLGALAVAIGINPLLLMIPATLSASCAFMLPVATPPNAIIFGTGKVTMAQLVRSGFWLNLIGIVLITIWTYLAVPLVFGVELGTLPGWAK